MQEHQRHDIVLLGSYTLSKIDLLEASQCSVEVQHTYMAQTDQADAVSLGAIQPRADACGVLRVTDTNSA